jgi:hypothetical protein
MTKVCSNEGCDEVIIPGGDFAFEAQGVFLQRHRGNPTI